MSVANVANDKNNASSSMDDIELQPASLDIWDKKYRLKTMNGEPVDEDINATYDRVARAGYLGEAQKIIYDDQPHLYVWNYTMNHGFKKELRGVNFSPAGVFIFRPSWRSWWIERADI